MHDVCSNSNLQVAAPKLVNELNLQEQYQVQMFNMDRLYVEGVCVIRLIKFFGWAR